MIRTHKSTIFCTAPPSTTIASLKEEALFALTSGLNEEEGIPAVSSIDEFELCRVIRSKQRDKERDYDVLEAESSIKSLKLGSWETLYIQFNDDQGEHPLAITLRVFIINLSFVIMMNITMLFLSFLLASVYLQENRYPSLRSIHQ